MWSIEFLDQEDRFQLFITPSLAFTQDEDGWYLSFSWLMWGIQFGYEYSSTWSDS